MQKAHYILPPARSIQEAWLLDGTCQSIKKIYVKNPIRSDASIGTWFLSSSPVDWHPFQGKCPMHMSVGRRGSWEANPWTPGSAGALERGFRGVVGRSGSPAQNYTRLLGRNIFYDFAAANNNSRLWHRSDPLYGLKSSTCISLTGVPNSGKSEWIDALLMNLSKNHGWGFALCSLEKTPDKHAIQVREGWSTEREAERERGEDGVTRQVCVQVGKHGAMRGRQEER
eukprot:scaffold137325_cov16-Tisochrysis_lutea.AAC.2